MKTSLLFSAPGVRLGLLASVLLSSSALAGPGPQFWQDAGNANTSSATASKAAVTATHLCPGAEIVAVTTMKPSWPNARGPLTAVQTGTKTVCHVCPVTTVATTNAWSNGRGPVTRTEVVKSGAAHDCGTSCAVAVK